MSVNKSLILALETAVEGGSISVWDYRQGVELGSLIGKTGVSKAEDVLENVGILLGKCSIDKNDFEAVVSATGAGSVTGLKIGAATAKGLAKSFGCRYEEISLWDALAAAFDGEKKKSSKIRNFYLLAGTGRVIRHRWHERQFLGNAGIVNLEAFYADLKKPSEIDCYVHEGLVETSEADFGIVCIRRNLAGYVGKIASDNAKEIGLEIETYKTER